MNRVMASFEQLARDQIRAHIEPIKKHDLARWSMRGIAGMKDMSRILATWPTLDGPKLCVQVRSSLSRQRMYRLQ